jgi:hypothetical protein
MASVAVPIAAKQRFAWPQRRPGSARAFARGHFWIRIDAVSIGVNSKGSQVGGVSMNRRKVQKHSLQVEGLDARDNPSAPAFPFYAGIVEAGAEVPPQAVANSAVCLDAVVDGPVLCLDGGFVPDGQAVPKLAANHNETFVRDRTRARKRK